MAGKRKVHTAGFKAQVALAAGRADRALAYLQAKDGKPQALKRDSFSMAWRHDQPR